MKEEDFYRNYEFLGEGISRKVFALNNEYVAKLAKDKEGIYQNHIEHFVYVNADYKTLKYLCPIVCFSPKLLIMKRANPITGNTKGDYVNLLKLRNERSVFRDINNLADKFHLFYEDLISVSSWGKLEGENVLIDYGCTTPYGDMYYDLLFLLNCFPK
jgi:hypothetical protein